jgi:hypothetical protein
MRAYLLLVLLLPAGFAAAEIPSGCQEDYSSCKEDCAITFGGSGRTLNQLTRCIGDCQKSLNACTHRHSSLKDLPPGVAADGARPTRKSEASQKAKKDQNKEENPFGSDEPAPRKPSGDDPYGDQPPANAKGGTDRPDALRVSESSGEEMPPAPAPVNRSRGTSSRVNAEETVSGTSAEGTKQRGDRASDAEPAPKAKSGLDDLEPRDAKPQPEPAPVAKSGTKAAPVKSAAEPVKPEPVKPAPTVAASREEKDPLLDEEPAVLPAPPPTRKPATTTTKVPARPAPAPEPKKDISEWDPNGD